MDPRGIFSPWLLLSSEPNDTPCQSVWPMAHTLTPNPGSLPSVSSFGLGFFAFLIYATFSYLMYCKLPCKPGVGPSINLNPQITNMALFQRVTLLHSNHVDTFTRPQTFILHGKRPRPCAAGATKPSRTGLAPAPASSQGKMHNKPQRV